MFHMQTLLFIGYAFFLLAVACGFDYMAKKVSIRSKQWTNSSFTYHKENDAWLCPKDQWLWPKSFDPESRVTRYQGNPVVCNVCPIKDTCTTSIYGKEIYREVDPWPFSDSGRFHRGISVAIGLMALLLALATLIPNHSWADIGLVSLSSLIIITIGVYPLAKHLWDAPTNYPTELAKLTDREIATSEEVLTKKGL